MKMKRYLFFLLLAAGVFAGKEMRAQQDPEFSQYMFNPLSINPAYAGSRGVMNGALAARRQWVGLNGAPTTIAFAVNAPTRRGKVGWGLEVISDQIGPKHTTSAYLNYAYRLNLGKGKLAFGLGAGVVSYKINWNDVEYKDNADAYAQLGTTSITKPDFKFGFYFNNKNFYIGGSATHLNQEAYTVVQDSLTFSAKMSTHNFLTFGRAFQLGDNVVFSPSVMIRSAKGVKQGNADLNLNFKVREALWLGVSIRSEKTMVLLAQYNITNAFKVGYSYDLTMSRLRTYQSGTHEIVLSFDLNLFQSQTLSPRFF
jgi:type IX secretion system PorP/SprF family membrane protein